MVNPLLEGLKGKRCLVTGAAGMIGRQVIRLLREAGVDVEPTDARSVAGQTILLADLSHFEVCQHVTKNRDFVFHIAGKKGSAKDTHEHASRYLVPMLQMDANMLRACAENGVPRLVYTSSIGAYAASQQPFKEDVDRDFPPMDPICWAKRMGELQIAMAYKERGLNWGCVRLAATYGPHDTFSEGAMLMPSLMFKIKRGDNPVGMGSPYPIRDFLYAGDAAEGIIRAAVKGTNGDFVNLGSGTACTVSELVDTIGKVIPFTYTFDTESPAIYQSRVMDINRAKEWLEWEPKVSLEEGLRRTWEWYLQEESC